MDQQTPPVMSIALLHPVLDALKAQGCSENVLAGKLSTTVAQMNDPETTLPAVRIYGFLKWATAQMGDPFLCAQIGKRMANGGWGPINPLLLDCRTVWEFLRRFSVIAEEQSGAATYRLEIEGRVGLWRLSRPKGSAENSQYADAIAVAFFVELFRRSRGADMNWYNCIAMVPDAELIPQDVLPRANVITSTKDMTLRFPSEWLERELEAVVPLPNLPEIGLPKTGIVDLGERVRQLLGQHLSDPNFGIEDVAEAIGIPIWKMQRNLRNANKSVAQIRNDLRLARAQDLLASTDQSISEVAASLGYISPSNFSRAFRARMKMNPIEYRKQQLSNAPDN